MIKWNGCWEDRSDRIICRWMVTWVSVGDLIAGCVAGYSGGGCFQLEKFIELGGKFHLESDCHLSDYFQQDAIQAAENCQDLILSYHDYDLWMDFENLQLTQEHIPLLVKNGDLLFGGDSTAAEFSVLFKKIGLISSFKS
jgi:hypothetical protein